MLEPVNRSLAGMAMRLSSCLSEFQSAMANHSHRTHPTTPMNERIKRFSIGAAIFLLSLVPFETNFSQEQGQLIKPCMAETAPKKKEDTTNTTRKKGRKRQKTKDEKKNQNDQQAKGSNCN